VIKKAFRTAQNYFPYLAELKNDFYHFVRAKLRMVHEHQFAAIRSLPHGADDLFLDVGANRGQSILAIRQFRPDARIVSFEPNPGIFERLKRRFGAAPGLTLINLGLSWIPSRETLYVPVYRSFVYDGLATMARDKARAYLSPDTVFFFEDAKLTVLELACETRTLDSFDLAPTFIKIDVEGFEHEVLGGAVETLRRHQPVLMIERFYENAPLREILTQTGYIEVVWKDGGFLPGVSDELNMFWMTPGRLAMVNHAR
jgi:FkbM family methyltransferase